MPPGTSAHAAVIVVQWGADSLTARVWPADDKLAAGPWTQVSTGGHAALALGRRALAQVRHRPVAACADVSRGLHRFAHTDQDPGGLWVQDANTTSHPSASW